MGFDGIYLLVIKRGKLGNPLEMEFSTGKSPKKIGGTYHRKKAYCLGLCMGISPFNMALCGTVPPFRILKFPLNTVGNHCKMACVFLVTLILEKNGDLANCT